MSLHERLQQALKDSNARLPPQARGIIDAAQDEIRQLGVETKAHGVGDYLADATFKSATSGDVILSELNENGPLIISFYRGGWCPYCNLELRAYQEQLDKITALGGNLVAITPEKPNNSLTTIEKNELTFPVLTDEGHAFAKAMGVAFELPLGIQNLFSRFGINIPDLNADTGWSLPVPATFVVDSTHRIILADVDVDYTHRLEPSKAVEALNSCIHAAARPLQ